MRVLVILNELCIGGCQINAIDHARHLANLGVESFVVGFENTLPNRGPTLLDVAEERGVQIEILEPQGTIIKTAPVLAAAADRHSVDIVHAYSSAQLRFGFWGPCRFGRRPLVMTMYEMEMPTYVVPRRQHLIVGTKYLEEEQIEARPGPTTLISPPVDTKSDRTGVEVAQFMTENDLEPTATRFVIVSRLDAWMKPRAVEHAMAAVERLGRPDIQLVVVGGGESEARLRATADEIAGRLGRKAIVFTGAMTDPRAAYASADVVLGMGGSAARGLSFGKPLIVTGENGWYQLFTPQSADALYSKSFWSDESLGDPVGALAAAMDEMVAHPDRRRELGGFGREFAERNFSLTAMSARLLDVYRTSLASHRRSNWFLDLEGEVGPAFDNLRRRLAFGVGG